MNWSIKLLKIKGIDVKVHVTFVLILVWAAYRWGINTGEGAQGALFGIVATLLLFASVTLHELSHSMQALKFGVRVRNITLMPMGGLAQMEEIPEDPNQELRIAIAGPLVNFGIAGLLIGAGLMLNFKALLSLEELRASLGSVSWSGLLAYLTSANLMLGLFNLIPAFPMDGGRILRALLAKKLSHAKATRIASQVGQGLALLMGLWGVMSGNWTITIIAIFVWMGAGQENQDVQVKHTLGEATVAQAMTRSPHAVRVNDPLSKAVDLTLSTSQADFPVLQWGEDRVVGILSEYDVLHGLKVLGSGAAVREVMQTQFPALAPDEPLKSAQQKMMRGGRRALPVEGPKGELLGLLTTNDLNEAYRLMAIHSKVATNAR